MILGLWGRLFVMAVGALIVILAVVVVTCFVGPGCWGFEYLHKEKAKMESRKRKTLGKIQVLPCDYSRSSSRCSYPLDCDDYVVYQTGLEEKTVDEGDTYHFSKEKVINLKCAPLLVPQNLHIDSKDCTPKLEMKLGYAEIGQENMARLAVFIFSATSLRCREYGSTLDCFILIEILNSQWSLRKRERIVHTVQTRVVKSSTNPVFDETFFFDVKKEELNNWCLKSTIFDNDDLTKPTPLYEKRVYLKEVKELTTTRLVPLLLDMQETAYSVGSLLLGISYLPTAQKLNISVIRASKINYQSLAQFAQTFSLYVRVLMVNNHGKCLKKKKTFPRRGDDSPVFKQSLIFDLSVSGLEQTVVLVNLCIKHSVDDLSLDGGKDFGGKETNDQVIGFTILGRNVKYTTARDHWVAVLQNPRKMISVWHDLR